MRDADRMVTEGKTSPRWEGLGSLGEHVPSLARAVRRDEGVRNELFSVELFYCLAEAEVMVEDWREDCNQHRPHPALAMMAPSCGSLRGRYLLLPLMPPHLRRICVLAPTGSRRSPEAQSDVRLCLLLLWCA